MKSPYMDYSLAPRANGWTSWLETVLVTALVIGAGLWLAPQDPLQVRAEFPWSVLAPVLIGVRYGFVRGLLSASLLVATFFVLHRDGLPAYASIAPGFIVGVLVCGMLVGEVRDLWERRLQRLQMANDYRQYRLDDFTRAHQILRVSHDRLEQRLAGSDQSLRSALHGLSERLRAQPDGSDNLALLAEPILALLGQYGSLRVAGLYRVDALAGPPAHLSALATVGTMEALNGDDLLVRLCLERRELVSVLEEVIEAGELSSVSSLQACIPLIDTSGQVLAILAVRQMPFFVFHERTLSLLLLLAGHIADLLTHDPVVLQLPCAEARHFARQLQRSLVDVEQHGLPACLYVFEITRPSDALRRLFEYSQRGLDLHLPLRNARQHQCLLVLLPLTSSEGGEGYLARLGRLVQEQFGVKADLRNLAVSVFIHDLQSAPQRDGLRGFLYNECGLNDQQVAV
ncbi:MAG TPA: PelD GGDEF domain-containing protein [Pseudomonas sp.]|uniref:PelD GGDEF domain-containing protein n=1 Tax=Pseudomonas sp. TaxID=306 RepID=UPI002B489335|nr:PelD GGDEF domain-containing protein [Pseudomonas sp.]HKS11659.1 PelD GGDEF domain-containing protein [Pseudomonas sp.]